MTDEAMRDLVTKHDTMILSMVDSVKALAVSQSETNKRLEDMTKFLTKQVIFSNKLDTMDKELESSFNRVHDEIRKIKEIQNDEMGCHSVRLLTKDTQSNTRDITRLIGMIETNRLDLDTTSSTLNTYPSTTSMRWFAGVLILYSVSFCVYVIQMLNGFSTSEAKVTVKLERAIVDLEEVESIIKLKKDSEK